MENSLLLTCDTFRDRSLCLHPNLAGKLGITQSIERQICFGSKRLPLMVHLCDELPEYKASLSSDIMDVINIPKTCHFEIYQKGNEIHLGPVIGLLSGYSNKSVKNKLDSLNDYILHYHDVKGIIIAFSIENIDRENLTVEGYVFNPLTKKWDKGTFPYPSSVFVITSSVSSKWIKHFQSVIGDSVFNDFYFNKWEIHRILADSIEVKAYLPETFLYKSPSELYRILIKFPTVMVKSRSAFDNSSVFYIHKDRNYIVLSSLSRGVIKRVHFNKDQAYSLFSKYFRKGEFIIQESMDNNFTRKIDFKIILAKNQEGIWKNGGLYSKQKKAISKTKIIYPIIKLEKKHLIKTLELSDLLSNMLFNEIEHIALDAVKTIEKSGTHFANAAIDMSVDEKGRIKILNIHCCNPSHEIALIAGHPEQYYEILKNNMLYAKKLAGFPY